MQTKKVMRRCHEILPLEQDSTLDLRAWALIRAFIGRGLAFMLHGAMRRLSRIGRYTTMRVWFCLDPHAKRGALLIKHGHVRHYMDPVRN
jgi:hypothetical protein